MKNNDFNLIFKKICVASRISFKEAKQILKEDTAHLSNSIIDGFCMGESNRKYAKMSYETLIIFLDGLIDRKETVK